MRQCTWKSKDRPRCTAEASHRHVHSATKTQLADLCEEHQRMLNSAVGINAAKAREYWIDARGGAEAEAARMAEE